MYDYPISWESVEKFPDKIKEKVKNEISGIKSENLIAQYLQLTSWISTDSLESFNPKQPKKWYGSPNTDACKKTKCHSSKHKNTEHF